MERRSQGRLVVSKRWHVHGAYQIRFTFSILARRTAFLGGTVFGQSMDYAIEHVTVINSGGRKRQPDSQIMAGGDPAAALPSAPAVVRGQLHGRRARCRTRECRSQV